MPRRKDFIPSITQVLLVKGTTPWDFLIKKATGSLYSHCCLAFEGHTYEMDFGGFYSRPIDTYNRDYDIFDIQGMTPEKSYLLRKWCLINRGPRYMYGKMLGQVFEALLHVSGLRSVLWSPRAFSSAEWCCRGLAAIGNPLQDAGQKSVTPGSIAKDPALTFVQSVASYKRRAVR